jgi:NTE family protein
LQVLEENDIHPDYIAGASIGSVMASLYAVGVPASDMKDEVFSIAQKFLDEKVFTKPDANLITPGKNKINGIADANKAERILYELFKEYDVENMEDVKTNLILIAVDLVSMKPVYFTNIKDLKPSRDAIVVTDIPLAVAIRSSCAYPGIVASRQINDMLLADGGLRINLPVEPLRDAGADKVMSLSMMKDRSGVRTMSAIKTAKRSIDIIRQELMELQVRSSDFNIDLNVGNIAAFDLEKGEEIYEKGIEYADEYRDRILEFCSKK